MALSDEGWRDRPPTAAEIAAHRDAHPWPVPEGAYPAGMWQFSDPDFADWLFAIVDGEVRDIDPDDGGCYPPLAPWIGSWRPVDAARKPVAWPEVGADPVVADRDVPDREDAR